LRHVAIVGSGPSGCYCAEALLRAAPDCRVDIIDRLPTPFGLVRFGVAPDHQATKGVARLLDRVLAKPEVGFFGGVKLERDVTLDELRALYDAVVVATGAPVDRRLGIRGEDLPGVFASGRFVGWYNHHPDHAELDLGAVRTAVVIGSGNVALDVARILVKSESEFHGSDLDVADAGTLAASGIERVYVIGRSPASAMKFTEAELLEFGELERAYPRLGAGTDLGAGDGKAVAALKSVTQRVYASAPIEIVFEFGWTPVAFEGRDRLEAVRFTDSSGAQARRPAQLAVTCIGYETRGHGLRVERGALANVDGLISEGLYVVGWAKRGPSGTIPANRTEAHAVAKRIAAEVTDGGRSGSAGLAAILAPRAVRSVDHAAWRRIDASEIARAEETRSRRKWRSLDELFAASERDGAP